jgi:hypothetical protein
VKYAFVVLSDNRIIEVGSLRNREEYLDRIGNQPQS